MSDVCEENPPVKQPRISSLQLGILRRLQERGPSTPYSLGASIGTLNSLELRKLVTADRTKAGSIAMPRTRVFWRITEEGCKLIEGLSK